MPVEQLDQGGKGLRRLFGRGLIHRRDRRRRGRLDGAGHAHLAQQVARGFGLGKRRLSQSHPEFALDAGEQFHPRQTVEAKITLKLMVQIETLDAVRARPQLARKTANEVEQLRCLGGREVRHRCLIVRRCRCSSTPTTASAATACLRVCPLTRPPVSANTGRSPRSKSRASRYSPMTARMMRSPL